MKRILATVAVACLSLGLAHPVWAQDPASMVQDWYSRYLGRQIDPEGLQNWASQLQSGVSPTHVQACILGSDEYYQRNGSTPDGFVRGLYRDILGRDANYDEIYGWVARLYATGSRIQLAEDFLNTSQTELSNRAAPQGYYGTTVVPAAPPAVSTYSYSSTPYSYVPYSYMPYHGYHTWGWHRPWYRHDYHQDWHHDGHHDEHHDGHHR